MAFVDIPDAGGDTLRVCEYNGSYYPSIDAEIVKGIVDVKIRDDDIFVCAYPKCGTHWVWEMVRLLLSGEAEGDAVEKDDFMLEFIGNETLEKAHSPRILNAHVLVDELPREALQKKCKMIFILRNPKDMAVSFFNHHKKLTKYYNYHGKWENYLPLLLEGKVDSGSYFTYIKDWMSIGSRYPDVPVLTLMYEDIKEDPLSAIKKIAKFLGAERSEDFYSVVMEKTSFNSMRSAKGKLIQGNDGGAVMYRKGEVGDWKNYFTVAQNEMFDKVYKEKMKGCDITFRYTL